MRRVLVALWVAAWGCGLAMAFVGAAEAANCGHGKCKPTTTTSTTVKPSTTTVAPTTTTTTVPPPPFGVLSACGPVLTPGSYVVDRDLPAPAVGSGQCLGTFVAGVAVDCQGHQVHSAYSEMVGHVTLRNCGFDAFVQIMGGDHFTLAGSTFTNGANLYTRELSDSDIGTSTWSTQPNPPQLGVQLTVSNSARVRVHDNVLDGGGVVGATLSGFDDGVVVSGDNGGNSTFITVDHNVISAEWDVGIETYGLVTDSTFSDNSISDASVAGIAGWFWNSWRRNVVARNTMSDVKFAFYFYNKYGAPFGNTVYFTDNQFTDNKVLSYKSIGTAQAAVFALSDILACCQDQVVGPVTTPEFIAASNNVFTRNDFGPGRLAPQFIPVAGFLDGGGNICGVRSQNGGSLVCPG